MSSDTITLIINLVTIFFVAGGFYYKTETKFKQLETDILNIREELKEVKPINERLARIETALDFIIKKLN